MKVNAFLTEIKSDYIIETNKLIRACFIFVGKKSRPQTKPKKRKCSKSTMVEVRKNKTVSKRVTETY